MTVAAKGSPAQAVAPTGTPPATALALPLAAASLRLRGKPGRPRTHPLPATPGSYNAGIAAARDRVNTGDAGRAGATLTPARPVPRRGVAAPQVIAPLRGATDRREASSGPPRLLDVHSAAAYMSVSQWTIRDLVAAGRLSRVRLPLDDARDVRRLLLDVRDLDQLIEAAKERA
jgi:hypothetical protein